MTLWNLGPALTICREDFLIATLRPEIGQVRIYLRSFVMGPQRDNGRDDYIERPITDFYPAVLVELGLSNAAARQVARDLEND